MTTCALCGQHCDILFVNETWAGEFHSACTHECCEPCLRACVEAQLPRCRAEGLLRVRCFAPGCPRVLPQALVLHVSDSARGAALDIDRQKDRLDPLYRGLQVNWEARTCPVCADHAAPLLESGACAHAACAWCWERWADAQLPRCRAVRQLEVRCFGQDCCRPVPEALLMCVSAGARRLQDELKRRARLQQSSLFPQALQVDCPRAGCLGLGYLGFDTVMCFVCEHQWPAADGAEAPGEGLPGEIKACPSCGVQIEKNGGCNHMTCRCGHEFFWTTLLPYRT